nr:FAD-dependent oxidoreductase [Streptomyces sp. DSM 41633]
MSTYDVANIGGGPAGLTAAAELARDSSLNVVVLERESEAGGIPRHSDHPGYGIRDMKTFIAGPAYARRLVREATAAGAAIRTATMVTGWAGDRSLELTSPDGRERLDARAVILATGARARA